MGMLCLMMFVFLFVIFVNVLLRNCLWLMEIGVMIDSLGVIMLVVFKCLLRLILSKVKFVGVCVKVRRVV